VTNAIKYTPDGGRIEVNIEQDRGQACICVKDTGLGLASHVLPNLFQPFVQVDKSIARSKGGLGLGLSLVKAIVELHNGKIEARSEGEGKGAEFIARLPLSAQASLRQRPPANLSGRMLRVVVVEDNEDARHTTIEFLRMLGHSVESASDGAEGIRVILESKPDLAVVDIGLPLIDGYELARQVRMRPELEIMLVALTGYGQPEDRDRALDAGFDVHLVKPLDFESLARVIAGLREQRDGGTERSARRIDTPSSQKGEKSYN
jgi:CheY-like chemotaxis protein